MMPIPAAPTLSICMPTWQRAALLDDCLAALVQAVVALHERGVSFEVVVSDNASTDATAEVVRSYADRLPLRYACQQQNHGAEANVVSALRLARGELCLYLADDDRLLTDGLLAAIDYLMADRSRSVVYAPWDVLDEVTGQSHGLFYTQAAVEDYGIKDGLRLLSRLAARDAFPEIGVYRTRMLHRVLPMPRSVHWAHVWAERLLAEGPLRLQVAPFYRCHARTRVKRDRPQLGNEQARTHVDRYRGGRELAFTEALRGQGPLPQSVRGDLARVIHWFVARRATVAARMTRAAGDTLAAVEIEQSIALRLGGEPPTLAGGAITVADATGADLSVCVVAQDAAELAARIDAMPALPSVEVVGVVTRGDEATIAVLNGRGARVVEVDAALGPQERVRAALLAATGWFAIVVEPGHVLDGERIQDAMGLMAGRPACVALCTPAADRAGAAEAGPEIYDPSEGLALYARCVLWGVRPELAIYRTGALQAALRSGALPLPRTFDAPWAWFFGMARRGEVCVDPQALRTGVGPEAASMDRLRAALEVTLVRALAPQAIGDLPESGAAEVLDLVEAPVAAHALLLAREAADQGDAVRALETLSRWMLWQADRRAPRWAAPLVDAAAAMIAHDAATTTAGWSGLVACGLPANVVQRIAALSPVEVRAKDACGDAPGLVVVPSRADAESLRHSLPPGQVMAWDDLRAMVLRAG
jgi:hypothetical protein